MSDTADTDYHAGQPVWVIQADGSERAAEYVGPQAGTSVWLGGPPKILVVYVDTGAEDTVEAGRVIPRET